VAPTTKTCKENFSLKLKVYPADHAHHPKAKKIKKRLKKLDLIDRQTDVFMLKISFRKKAKK